MVLDFLKKYQEELISQKIEIKEDLDLLETKIKEETKFLSILEDNNESYFSVFTPRNVNEKNNDRANEIKQNLLELNSNLQSLNEKMIFIDGRLQEVTALVNLRSVSSQKSEDKSLVNTSFCSDKKYIISRLEDIKCYVFQDPQRTLVELETLINDLS